VGYLWLIVSKLPDKAFLYRKLMKPAWMRQENFVYEAGKSLYSIFSLKLFIRI